MDAQAKKKALYRAKLKAQKQEKRIEDPLVRYNEHDQPVCRVCDVVLKSESSWNAHQISSKHREAINSLKAKAAAAPRVNNIKSVTSIDVPKIKPEHSTELHNIRPRPSQGQPSSALPSDFFDKPEAKRQKTGFDVKLSNSVSKREVLHPPQTVVRDAFDAENNDVRVPGAKVMEPISSVIQPSSTVARTQKMIAGSEPNHAKGALPEGFFDDKNADLLARGIKPVKPDLKDEYKEFEKLIQEDLQEVDNRLEEEEYDAADMIEEAESVEQRTYRERVEMLKRKKMELKAARSASSNKTSQVVAKEPTYSSSDSDSDDNLVVDWRAKRL